MDQFKTIYLICRFVYRLYIIINHQACSYHRQGWWEVYRLKHYGLSCPVKRNSTSRISHTSLSYLDLGTCMHKQQILSSLKGEIPMRPPPFSILQPTLSMRGNSCENIIINACIIYKLNASTYCQRIMFALPFCGQTFQSRNTVIL